VPLAADMSSDILAVRRPWERFGLIYAGAQKNAGPAGVTMVVIRRDFLATAKTDLPPMLSYATQA
jgi:phosphoserine aminotransferase